ncbi:MULTISPECIES: molybdenum cofactor guanylyltransferase [Clostridium]|uniref:Probable molybdenum cofactor guanylyltransferase n=1 Tax=Clostridium nitritogenes TaxID=83340 RepID=A0ABN1LRQ8_9CLOT|nr:molybdenum cofactor guanylyltransferase [Clostridium baratii]MBT9831157.1 NTP transferase domain-containing protein [Clostridium baratii]MDY3206319.1 molybdenum cofactor guanylyltransferase [Clostridium baratii]STB00466.1 molybdopterin-guanine biosynthesis protein [Clostridium baratii]
MINRAVIILSGGKNTRMNGKTKAFLNIDGYRFIDNILLASSDYKEKIISCNDISKYLEFKDVKLVVDKFKEIGPIGGIYSALKETTLDEALIVAGDMPFLNKEILNFLGNYKFNEDVLVPVTNGKVQPLCSIYKKRVLETILKMIEEKDYKLKNLLNRLNVKYIDIENGESFSNINTVYEYEKILNKEKSE